MVEDGTGTTVSAAEAFRRAEGGGGPPYGALLVREEPPQEPVPGGAHSLEDFRRLDPLLFLYLLPGLPARARGAPVCWSRQ